MKNRTLLKVIELGNHNKTMFIVLSILLLTGNNIYSQEIEFRKSSITTGIGIGFIEGKEEAGIGPVFSIGWQKSFGKKNKIRINPNMIIGAFYERFLFFINSHTITSLGVNIHYDLLKYKAVSIVTTGGGFINYSKGSTGSFDDIFGGSLMNPHDFTSLYFGGNVLIKLRIDPKKSPIAVEITPVSIHRGNKGFELVCLMFGIDFKFKNRK